MPNTSLNILIGRKAICQYIAKEDGSPISWKVVQKFIHMGMPCICIDKTWYAYAEHIDAFFKKLTFAQPGKDMDLENGD